MDMALDLADHAGFEARRRTRGSAASSAASASPIPIEVAGGPYTGVNPDTAELRVNPDGSVSLFAGTTSMGQGNETAFTQIVSDRLGVPPERIQVFWGDSDLLGAGRGNGGSGAARRAAARRCSRATREGQSSAGGASPRRCSEAAPEDVVLARRALHRGGHRQGRDVRRRSRATAYQPRAAPRRAWSPAISETAAFTPPSVTFPNGCQRLRGRDRPETRRGRDRALHAWSTTSARMVNPLLVKGQIHGGIVQGLGQALLRAPGLRRATGQLLTGSFMDYAMPRADDARRSST